MDKEEFGQLLQSFRDNKVYKYATIFLHNGTFIGSIVRAVIKENDNLLRLVVDNAEHIIPASSISFVTFSNAPYQPEVM
jgi:hypothetical protein